MKARPTWARLRLPLFLSLLWCLLMLVLYHRGSAEKDDHANQLALIQTRTLFEQIIDTRAWNAALGGVYVPESPYGQPNPWIPEEQRTLTLKDGSRLVLINPAYMSRQISELTTRRGTSFRITSQTPLRPQNDADPWERQALSSCMAGEPEVFTFINDEAGPRYRYLSALRADQSCLNCHQDNKVGDVRGGVSVTLDAQPFLRAMREQTNSLVMAFSLMGLAGVLSIGGASFLVRRKQALAEEKERLKSAFLANMSHDMRTPLTGIMGMSELLRHESVPERRERALRYLGVAGGALLEMVNDITGYAALDSGRIQLAHKAFDLHQSLAQCIDLFRPQCEIKGLSLSLDMGAGVPRCVLGDGFRLRQVLGNLISNGVKFTEQGGVHLDVRLAAGSPMPQKNPTPKAIPVRFSVKDTGIGVNVRDQARIFQRFERGAESQGKDMPGTGLGLSIAQEIVQLMDGKLEVESCVGKGSCFYFTIWFTPAPDNGNPAVHNADTQNGVTASFSSPNSASGSPAGPAATANTTMPTTPPAPFPAAFSGTSTKKATPSLSLAGMRVLLAEDNTVAAYYMESVLRHAGCVVLLTRDGVEALQLLKKEKVDVVLLDVRMPEMDGMTVARRMRLSPSSLNTTPIVVLSASMTEEELAAFRGLDISCHLIKPISAAQLTHAVARAVGMPLPAPLRDAAPGTPGTPVDNTDNNTKDNTKDNEDAMPDIPVFDAATALQDMDNDRALLRRLITLWLDDVPQQWVRLRAAMRAQDAPSVHRIAHAWKNSAGSLHLMRVRHVCTRLEKAEDAMWDALLHELEREDGLATEALRSMLASSDA